MFVRRSKYNDSLRELIESRKETQEAYYRLHGLQARWNKLVDRINAKGGEAFLNHGQIYGYSTAVEKQFTNDELKSLLRLVHPDKHGGRDTATQMFQKINELL